MNGDVSFEKMREDTTFEFVMGIVNRFNTLQSAFSGVTRAQRDQTMLFKGMKLVSND